MLKFAVVEKHAGLSNQTAAEFIDLLPTNDQILSLRLKRPSVDEETFLFNALANMENMKISNAENCYDIIDKNRNSAIRRKASIGVSGKLSIELLPDDLKLHMMEFFSIPSLGAFSKLNRRFVFTFVF